MPHAQERLLKHAPITEAVIALRVKMRKDFASHIDALRAAFVESLGSVESQTEEKPPRLIFPATPTSEAVQVSEDVFAFSKLPPYTSWEDVRDSARRHWDVYRKVVDVESVSRLGVRYINQFELRHHQRFDDYMAVSLPIPETVESLDTPRILSRLAVEDKKAGASAIVFYVRTLTDSGSTVIIDTDAEKAGEFDATGDEMWRTFEELRRLKNRIFFGSITEVAAKEFEA